MDPAQGATSTGRKHACGEKLFCQMERALMINNIRPSDSRTILEDFGSEEAVRYHHRTGTSAHREVLVTLHAHESESGTGLRLHSSWQDQAGGCSTSEDPDHSHEP